MMGDHIMEESPEEKYLGDMIHTDGLAASILSTVNKRLNLAKEKGKQIFWRRMAPKLKKIEDDDKYIALKAKMNRKKEEQALNKNYAKTSGSD